MALTSAGTITQVGLTAMLTAQLNSQIFQAAVVQITGDVMSCTGLETALTNPVFNAPASMVSQSIVSPNAIRTTLQMDTSVGNFSIGTMGLFTSGGVLFALGTFPGGGMKLADNLPGLAGNLRTLCLDVGYVDITSALTPLTGSIIAVQLPIALKYVNGAVTARQLRTALANMGALTTVISTIASSDPSSQPVIDWNTCAAVQPLGALVEFVATAIGATDNGVALMTAAALLPA